MLSDLWNSSIWNYLFFRKLILIGWFIYFIYFLGHFMKVESMAFCYFLVLVFGELERAFLKKLKYVWSSCAIEINYVDFFFFFLSSLNLFNAWCMRTFKLFLACILYYTVFKISVNFWHLIPTQSNNNLNQVSIQSKPHHISH